MSNFDDYVPFTPSAAASTAKSASRKSAFISKIPVGISVFRILPAKKGEVNPFVRIAQHWFEAPRGSGKRRNVNCLRELENKPCPLCMQVDKWRASGDPALEKQANDLDTSPVFFANVIDRSAPENGVVVWQIREGMMRDILTQYENLGRPDFTHPLTGRDIAVTRVGTTRQDTKYTVTFRDPMRVADSDEQIGAWLGAAKPLARTYAKTLTVPQIAHMLQHGELPKKASGPSVDISQFTAAPQSLPGKVEEVQDADFRDTTGDDDTPF